MAEEQLDKAKDWASSFRAYVLAWGLPTLAIVAGALTNEATRTIIWSIALGWMGSACLMNARRCGRTHCRYTAPFYLLLIVPVMLHGFNFAPLGPYAWWMLGAAILFGGKLIWWGTERAWGKYVSSSN